MKNWADIKGGEFSLNWLKKILAITGQYRPEKGGHWSPRLKPRGASLKFRRREALSVMSFSMMNARQNFLPKNKFLFLIAFWICLLEYSGELSKVMSQIKLTSFPTNLLFHVRYCQLFLTPNPGSSLETSGWVLFPLSFPSWARSNPSHSSQCFSDIHYLLLPLFQPLIRPSFFICCPNYPLISLHAIPPHSTFVTVAKIPIYKYMVNDNYTLPWILQLFSPACTVEVGKKTKGEWWAGAIS